MADFKCTIFMRVANFGFSESYYCTAADADAADVLFKTLAVQRANCAADDTAFIGYRISDDNIRGDVWPRATGYPTAGTSGEGPSYFPDVGVLYKLFTGSGSHSSRILRGCAATTFGIDGAYIVGSAFEAQWILFSGLLISSWKIASLVLPPPGHKHSMVTITGAEIERSARRRCGRPFALPVGRRPLAT